LLTLAAFVNQLRKSFTVVNVIEPATLAEWFFLSFIVCENVLFAHDFSFRYLVCTVFGGARRSLLFLPLLPAPAAKKTLSDPEHNPSGTALGAKWLAWALFRRFDRMGFLREPNEAPREVL
jgi:hypothetical protein